MTLDLPLLPAGSRPFDVVGFGESSFDIVAVVDQFPTPNDKAALGSLDFRPGGQIATAMAACARLGLRARFHGHLGYDMWGRRLGEVLRGEAVDVVDVQGIEGAARLAIILVDRSSGERTVLERRDPGASLTGAHIDLEAVTSGRVLLVDGTDLPASTAAARAARRAGIPTVCDVDRVVPGVDELLAEIDVIVTGETFPSASTGVPGTRQALAALVARFRPALAIATLGPAGALAMSQEGELLLAPPAVTVVDSTGAGDAFRAGLIAAWLAKGRGADVGSLVSYANAVAALSCTRPGAIEGLPTSTEVNAFVTGARGAQSKQ